MSEPYGAFMRLSVARTDLLRWLEAPPAKSRRWTDWLSVGGSWYLEDAGPGPFAEAGEQAVSRILDDATALLERWPTVRQALRGLMRGQEAVAARRVTYDPDAREFVAGTLYYEEGLLPFLAFLTLARGSEDVLGPEESGVVAIHDYVFAPDDDEPTAAALALGPGRSSRVLTGDDRGKAAATFQGIADVMVADRERLPPPIDHLDSIR